MAARKRQADAAAILLVEDDRELSGVIGSYLDGRGHTVDFAHDGLTGIRLAEANEYDIVVTDGMLPGLDGLEVVRRVRAGSRKDVPILMLTGRTGLEDKVAALETGADDYLCKPFDLRELDARIRALIRRDRQEVAQATVTVGDLRFDPGTFEVHRAGKRIELSPIGLRLLAILMRESPKVVTRAQLERHVWGDGLPDSDTLRSHLYILRNAIDKPFKKPLLHTIPSIGYRMSDSEVDASSQ
ncbi:response regulator transcription factor [Dyella sp. C11]|uniref:response regulator transcription factor n=1 Tax=Dyella sp. C11 TaxID=2126991 RepID=UPI000D64C334|nr:response regulator transcription factor [Dyella sp. C11]